MEISRPSPKELGYRFPAEFEQHAATWLSWPHNQASWPGKMESIFPSYCRFIEVLSQHEAVHINVVNEEMKDFAKEKLAATTAKMDSIKFYTHPTNDAWCRDHGPAFLINPTAT
ncbi:MAG TPA: agmatine deiminase family protein, partial [Chitinophagaceae bacterium]|nr:agmatine deiminase family protein [Chitinophagaceae bacterium]